MNNLHAVSKSGPFFPAPMMAAIRDSGLVLFIMAAVLTFFAVPLLLAVARTLGLYTIVEERQCKVYVLFGKVVAVIDQPGLHLLLAKLGLKAPLVTFLGKCHTLDLRLDQSYLRSTPVNSEEGAPMGIGVWYEMVISDPVAYLFKNADPRGSLAANVGNSTVRCLSNLKLAKMLENRHPMSQTVRDEVSPQSQEWGYTLGSVYIRKVHFRDAEMTKQIEEKVVNRLRQVTGAIKQDGINQVSIISSTAEREAANEFARAAAVRPQIVGAALQKISQDTDISRALFETLETQKIIEGQAEITVIPKNSGVLGRLIAANPRTGVETAVTSPPPK
jgi:regulator of protease activity HflC (stomatin/prohibitin superfamily)